MNQLAQKRPPFPSGWFSWGLGSFRPCDATYCLVPYESLPPIPAAFLQGTLHWLIPLGQDIYYQQWQEDYYTPSRAFSSAQWERNRTSTHELSISFPDAFQLLMNSPELMDRIPSCTDCYFELSEKLVPCPGREEDSILRFLNDSQGQIAWYLYLTAQGKHCVLAGYPLLDLLSDPESPEYGARGITEKERRMVFEGRGVYVCASSFEEFLYRFWIENMLSYKLDWYEGLPSLTEEEKSYLSHYRPVFSSDDIIRKTPQIGIKFLP